MRVGIVYRGIEFNNYGQVARSVARSYPEYMESPEALSSGVVYMVVMHVRRAEMFMTVCA